MRWYMENKLKKYTLYQEQQFRNMQDFIYDYFESGLHKPNETALYLKECLDKVIELEFERYALEKVLEDREERE